MGRIWRVEAGPAHQSAWAEAGAALHRYKNTTYLFPVGMTLDRVISQGWRWDVGKEEVRRWLGRSLTHTTKLVWVKKCAKGIEWMDGWIWRWDLIDDAGLKDLKGRSLPPCLYRAWSDYSSNKHSEARTGLISVWLSVKWGRKWSMHSPHDHYPGANNGVK